MKNIPILIMLVWGLSACQQDDLKGLGRYQLSATSSGKAQVDFCTIPADTIKSDLRFIIVMDRSGSNNYRPDNLDPTDTDGNRRFRPLLTFLDNFAQDENIYWSMINFSTDAAIVKNFTNDLANNFRPFIEDQYARTQNIDQGWTNYVNSLERVKQLIREDVARAKKAPEIVSSVYVVFFISDGAPYVNEVLQETTAILSDVGEIIALQKENPEYIDSIQISTGYYYSNPSDPQAQDLLQEMANAGSGDALVFGEGQEIDYSQFSVPERIAKHFLREVWVTNANSLWVNSIPVGATRDYQYMYGIRVPDTDGDGLNNLFEEDLGSNPLFADSDGNGVSDGVEYLVSAQGRPCADVSCAASKADPYLSCVNLQLFDANKQKYFGDKDKDGLNDCEEKLLGSNISDFDSNNDYIPDRLALRNQFAFIGNEREESLDPDKDGITNYNELKLGTPLRFNNAQILDLKTQSYKLVQKSETSQKTCYSLEVQEIALTSDNDTIRVYVLENTAIIDKKKFMRVAEKPMPQSRLVTFSADDFVYQK